MFDIENVYEPKTLEEALQYLHEHKNSIVICGGTDVLIKNREGKLRGLDYVVIRHLPALHGVRLDEEGNIHIGPATEFSYIEKNPIINQYCDFLGFAVGQVGGPQIREVATIGGNLSNGVPSADSAASSVVLCCQMHIESHARGKRVVDIHHFHTGAGKTCLQQDEILTDIVIPKEAYEGYVGKYVKYAMRKAMDIATLGMAMMLKVENNSIKDIKIAYGVMAATPIRAPKLEAALRGQAITEALMDVIDEHYMEDIQPRDSWRASREFRKKVMNEVLKRSLSELVVKSGGKDVYRCGYDR